MVLPITKAQVARAQKMSLQITALQRELFALGLPATSAQMAKVNHRIGWELAERMGKSGLVSKDEERHQKRQAAFDARYARTETTP